MERLTVRNNFVLDNAINAYEHTADSALDRRTLDFLKELREYRKLEEQGLLLRLDSKEKLIEVLATKLFNSEFGRCYMCTNLMKNITLDGVNNGCDGMCSNEEFTVDDFLKKIVEEIQRKETAEQALKQIGE